MKEFWIKSKPMSEKWSSREAAGWLPLLIVLSWISLFPVEAGGGVCQPRWVSVSQETDQDTSEGEGGAGSSFKNGLRLNLTHLEEHHRGWTGKSRWETSSRFPRSRLDWCVFTTKHPGSTWPRTREQLPSCIRKEVDKVPVLKHQRVVSSQQRPPEAVETVCLLLEISSRSPGLHLLFQNQRCASNHSVSSVQTFSSLGCRLVLRMLRSAEHGATLGPSGSASSRGRKWSWILTPNAGQVPTRKEFSWAEES